MNERLEKVKKALLRCDTLEEMDAVEKSHGVEWEDHRTLALDPELEAHAKRITGLLDMEH